MQSFFCLLGFYFILHFGLKINTKYLFFCSYIFWLSLSFKTCTFGIFNFSTKFILFIFYIYFKKFKLIKYPFLGSFIFLSIFIVFIFVQKIDFDMFLLNYFYYPISIGGERLSSLNINFEKIISNYKFIILPLIISLFLLKETSKN